VFFVKYGLIVKGCSHQSWNELLISASDLLSMFGFKFVLELPNKI
jgi:hypothetical protein